MNTLYDKTMSSCESYFHPKTVAEAVSLLTNYGREAKVLAGGTDLLNLIRNRVLMPRYIIDIKRIAELNYIDYNKKNGLRIGALATISALGVSKIVKDEYPILHEAVCQMGSTQVRNMATVGGNLCRASPSADMVPPLLALNAVVKIAGRKKTKVVPLDEFFIGPGETILKYYEILTEIQVPRLPVGSGSAFLKKTRVAVDLAKVNIASVLIVKNGVCEEARIALGGIAPTPIRAHRTEDVLKGKRPVAKIIEEAAEIAADETKPITDIRSPADYRKELTKVLVRRAIMMSLQRPTENDGE